MPPLWLLSADRDKRPPDTSARDDALGPWGRIIGNKIRFRGVQGPRAAAKDDFGIVLLP